MFCVEISLGDAERHTLWTQRDHGTVTLDVVDPDGPTGDLVMLAHSSASHGLSLEGVTDLYALLDESEAMIHLLTCYPRLVARLQKDLIEHPRVRLIGDWNGETKSFHIKSSRVAYLFAKENR